MADDLGGNLLLLLTLVVLEAVLSFDNAAILAVMSRRLPVGRARARALNYGLIIAYGLRFAAIVGVVFLVQNAFFLVLGGAYLLFLFVRHFVRVIRHREHRDAVARAPRARWGLSSFQLVVLQIAVIDLAFALDQVVAAVAFVGQDNPYAIPLIAGAAFLGLVALRALAPAMSRLMDWLPLLEHMAFVAVGLVGTLLLAANLATITGWLHDAGLPAMRLPQPPTALRALGWTLAEDGSGYELLAPVKVGLTLALFLVPVVIKFFFDVPRGRPPHRATVTQALDASEMTGAPPAKK